MRVRGLQSSDHYRFPPSYHPAQFRITLNSIASSHPLGPRHLSRCIATTSTCLTREAVRDHQVVRSTYSDLPLSLHARHWFFDLSYCVESQTQFFLSLKKTTLVEYCDGAGYRSSFMKGALPTWAIANQFVHKNLGPFRRSQ